MITNRLDTFPNKDLIQQYRNVFSSKDGSIVFYHMMFELGMLDQSGDEALRNYAIRLQLILGGGEISQSAVEAMFNKLKSQPLPVERKEE